MSDYLIYDENLNQYAFTDCEGTIYEPIWQARNNLLRSSWLADEVDFSNDYSDWLTLSDEERRLIKMTLAFFARADSIVVENIMLNMINATNVPAIRSWYVIQAKSEDIHAESYALQIKTIIKDPLERENMFKQVDMYPVVQKKEEWAKKWIENNDNKMLVLFGLIITEGLFFSNLFAIIFWMKNKNKLSGITESNDFIFREETLHRDVGCMLYLLAVKLGHKKVSTEEIYNILSEAIEIEKQFASEVLEKDLIGLNKEMLFRYTEYISDNILESLGYEKMFNIRQNPLPYMENLKLDNITNFFEKTPTEYHSTGINSENITFNLEEIDF